MVKKLFKHEYHFYLRIMAIVYAILLTMSVATRLIMTFESDTQAYEIISGLTLFTYVVSILATFGFAFVLSIVRFYKNMFTAEGYLTNTLPVTAGQHIAVKAITAVSFTWLSAIMVILSVLIALPSELLREIFAGFQYVGEGFQQLDDPTIAAHLIALVAEYFLILVIAPFSGLLLYYSCISIGQLFKKNRILAAVGVYFAYYILAQIFTTIVTINLAFVATSGYFYDIIMWIGEHPVAFMHIMMWAMIVLSAIFVLAEYFLNRWIITKKLNLE